MPSQSQQDPRTAHRDTSTEESHSRGAGKVHLRAARRIKRRPDPAAVSPEEVCSAYSVNPAMGLLPKEVERRRARSAARPLFATAPRRFFDHVGQVFREPVLWVLLTVCAIALFFDRVALGIVCAVLILGHCALSAYMAYRAEQIDAAMQAYDAPLVRVLRNRRILRMGADELVCGDIIFLNAGDIVPADCRLLDSDGLVITERELSGRESERRAVRLSKDASALCESRKDDRLSPENMAFAGGVVDCGMARALVVAVGDRTHLGGLLGRVAPAHPSCEPRTFRRNRKHVSAWNLAMVILVIPVVAVGILTVRDEYELMDLFLTAVCLGALSLTEHIRARSLYAFAADRARAARDRDVDNSADIKTTPDLEKLCTVTDLVLVGTAALHDGACYPESLRIGEDSYNCHRPEADGAARRVAELLFLYRRGMTTLPTLGISATDAVAANAAPRDSLAVAEAFCVWAEPDVDATLLRVDYLSVTDSGVTVFPHTGEGYRIVLTADYRVAASCSAFSDRHAERKMEDADREELYRAYRTAIRSGHRVFFLLTERESGTTLEATLTYAPHTCPKTAGCIRGMEAAGITVVSFMRTASDENIRLFSECGLTENASAYTLPADGTARAAAELVDEGVRAFEGGGTAYIMDYIRARRDEGRCVAVLSVDRGDLSLLDAADLAVTCSPALFASAFMDHSVRLPMGECEDADGEDAGRCATDLCRRRADVLVRRSRAGGGGVCGVRRALLAADHLRDSVYRSVRFILLSQVLRLVSVLLPLCFGLSLLPAPALLLSGLCLDLAAVICHVCLPLATRVASPRSLTDTLGRPLRDLRRDWISLLAAIVLPWLIAGICRLADVGFGSDLSYFAVLCLFATQLVLFLCSGLPKKSSAVFLTVLVFVCFYVGAIAAALGAGLHWLWSLILPMTAPAAYLLTRYLLGRLGRKTK